ncbi:ABC transporter ATP-binding protein, partial [Candidatus Parcubacteria bacterium]|nr:ABC transporter ATP-binding protein [Candidatus Parcubacteria bacterium]
MGLKRQKERIKKIIRLLNQAFGIYKLQIIVLIALGFIGGILEGIGINALIPMLSFVTGDSGNEFDFITQIIRKFFDALNIDFSLKFLLIFICTLFILKAIVLLVFNYVKIKIATDYERNFRVKLLKNTINADWAFLLKQKIGYIENTIMNDIATGSMLLNSISGIIMITTGLLIYVVVALNISAFITFITLIIGIFILFIFKPLLYRIKVAAFNAQKMNKKVAHLINENLIGAKTIKSIGAEDHVINFGKSFFEELKRLRIKLFLLGSISMSAIQPITIIFVCAIFAISYKSSNFNFTSLIVIIYLIQRIFSYIQQFQTNFNKLMKAAPFLASALRYDDLVKKNKESGGRGKKFIFNKNIKFNNISFSYNN